MKYEDIIRKIFKNYKSKREMKKELEQLLELYKNEPVKIIREKVDVIPIKCERRIDRYEINWLNEHEKDAVHERIKYSIKKEMFDYLIDNNIIKFTEEINHYEDCVKLTGFMQVVR